MEVRTEPSGVRNIGVLDFYYCKTSDIRTFWGGRGRMVCLVAGGALGTDGLHPYLHVERQQLSYISGSGPNVEA